MSRSDSKIDLAKYKPSIEDARRIASEDAAEDRMRKALDNPALDAALEELHGPAAPAGPEASPWAKGSPHAGGIDKAALPSSGAPAPPVTAPIKAGPTRRTGAWTPARKGLAAIALAFLPAMVVFVLFVKPLQGTAGAPSASAHPPAAAPKASASTPEAASPSVSIAPSAVPTVTAAPSAAPTASATVQPAPVPTTPAPRRPKPRSALDDPFDTAPSSPKTAEPAPPPSSSPSPPPKPEIIN